jgi:hypothetical protein
MGEVEEGVTEMVVCRWWWLTEIRHTGATAEIENEAGTCIE